MQQLSKQPAFRTRPDRRNTGRFGRAKRRDNSRMSSSHAMSTASGANFRRRPQGKRLSLEHGFRLLSSYRTAAGDKLWVITEADRSVTTLLLPEEY